MNTPIKWFPNYESLKELRLTGIIAGALLLMVACTVLSDYWFTVFQKSPFYISESLLFSSYWLLYFPSLVLLPKLVQKVSGIRLKIAITASAIVLHLVLYPALVWLLSSAFYYHTFDYRQTFSYGLTAYFIESFLIYAFLPLALTILRNHTVPAAVSGVKAEEIKPQNFISSIQVTDNNQSRFLLATKEICYITANPPYVNLHLSARKYLLTQTLKSLEIQLDPDEFVRIHRSHIVNVRKIRSWVSRQNGDYDLVLTDGSTLRVSRNYARAFKSRMAQITHLTAK